MATYGNVDPNGGESLTGSLPSGIGTAGERMNNISENLLTDTQKLEWLRAAEQESAHITLAELAGLAANVCRTPYAALSLDGDEGTLVTFGFEQGRSAEIAALAAPLQSETGDIICIEDTATRVEFKHHPLVTAAPALRFIALATLTNSAGFPLGWLAVFDTQPRRLIPSEVDGLHAFARQVVDQVDLRRKMRELARLRQVTLEAEQQLKFALESSTLSAWDWDIANQRVTIGKDWAAVLGQRANWRWIDANEMVELIHPEDRADIRNRVIATLKGQTPTFYAEHRMRDVSGTWRWVLMRGKVTERGADGRAKRVIGTFEDITRRKRAEHNLLREKNFSLTLMDSLPGIFMLLDEDGRIVRWNGNLERSSGYAGSEIVGLDALDLFAEPDKPIIEHRIHAALTQHHSHCEARFMAKNGDTSTLLFSARLVDMDGKRYVACVGTDISEQKRAEERAEFLATRDALTGLPNRTLLRDRLYQGISNARRRSRRLAVMFLDLDRFKTVNDSLGHHVGDELLKHVAKRIGVCLRQNDTLARLGGDEFIVVLNELREHEGAAVVARKIIDSVSQPLEVDGHTLDISCSIGVSMFPSDGEDADTLMKHADTAMYHAKESARGSYQFFSPRMNASLLERMAIETDLKKAIVNNQFLLHYQPKVDLGTGRAEGFEALVRWQHPSRGLLLPEQFIPVAEETGLIIPLGEWVLRAVCRQIQTWRQAGLRSPSVAINLSAAQLMRRDALLDMLTSVLNETQLEPSALEFEITESLLLRDLDGEFATLKSLGELGMTLTIDDFGKGYSSLSYLKRLPIDALKIDRSFVNDVVIDADDSVIVSAIVAMAHRLGLRVIAEGVETQEQVQALTQLDCDMYQGYHFSHPLPASEAERYLLAA